jgi:hypothetical protein
MSETWMEVIRRCEQARSDRQLEARSKVLQLRGDGMKNAEIAAALAVRRGIVTDILNMRGDPMPSLVEKLRSVLQERATRRSSWR